MGKISQYISVK